MGLQVRVAGWRWPEARVGEGPELGPGLGGGRRAGQRRPMPLSAMARMVFGVRGMRVQDCQAGTQRLGRLEQVGGSSGRAPMGPVTVTVPTVVLRGQLTLPLCALDSIGARAVVHLKFQVQTRLFAMDEPCGPNGHEPAFAYAVKKGKLPGKLLTSVCTKLEKTIGRWTDDDVRPLVELLAGWIEGVDGYSSPEDRAGAMAYGEVSIAAGIQS